MKRSLLNLIFVLLTVTVFSQTSHPYSKQQSINDIDGKVSKSKLSVPRVPFFEEFASSTCGPCASFNSTFNPWCLSHADNITLLKYPMNWPGSGDPYYSEDGLIRRTFYGVNAVPDLYGNGSKIATNINAVNNFYGNASSWPAFLSIDGNFSVTGTNISINANILPLQDFPPVTLHVAVFEQTTTGNATSNGETEFHNIVMKMVPDALGTIIDLNNMEIYHFSQTVSLSGTNVEDYNDLGVVFFIQDTSSKEIYQSAYGLEDNVSSSDARLSEILVDSIPIEGFNPDIFTYEVELAEGQDTLVSVVGFPMEGNPDIFYNYPEAVPGDVIINVISEDLTATSSYTIHLALFPNQVPTDIALSVSNVDENLPVGASVGTLMTVDNDANDLHTYSFVTGEGDADNFRFTLLDDQLYTAETFDYETRSTYSIRIQTNDGEGGIFSKPLTIIINNINDIIIINTIYSRPFCPDEPTGAIEIEVGEFVPPLSFMWSTGQQTQNLFNIPGGFYSVTITDGDGMVLIEEFTLEPRPIYEGTNVCYLTSEGLFNVVYIDKGTDNYNVDKYNVYREGSNIGVYEKIGEISSDDDSFTDSTINNMNRSYSYKVSMTDKCGNESAKSLNHSTIHLSINSGTNNEVNLYWSHYQGISTPKYMIYRKFGSEFILLQEISSNNNTYTDFPPELNSLYEYYLSFEVEYNCNTNINRSNDDVVKIESNHVSLGSIGSMNEYYAKKIQTYPNPVNDKLIVNLESMVMRVDEILLYNSNGTLVFSSIGKNIDSAIIEIPVHTFSAGLYNLCIFTNNGLLHKKIVISR